MMLADDTPLQDASSDELPGTLTARRRMANIRTAALFGGCIAIPLIIWLSLIPGDMQTRTGLPKQGEHFLAYFLTAACIALVMKPGRQRLCLAIGLPILAGALEVAQAMVPGRTPGFDDFIGGCLGAWCGVAATAAALALIRRTARGSLQLRASQRTSWRQSNP